MHNSELTTFRFPVGLDRLFRNPWSYLLMGAGVLFLDYVTGPHLQFPILFVIPVVMSAWYCDRRLAGMLAVLLPAGRIAIALIVDHPSSTVFIFGNAAIRAVVLGLLAYLVDRTARQTKALRERVAGLVTICAWSRTVEHKGQWISFEEYLKQRFGLETSHGISPAELDAAMRRLGTELGHRKESPPNDPPDAKDTRE